MRGVGYLSQQTYHYWRGTAQVSEPYEAFVPHHIAGWAPHPDRDTLSRLGAADEHLRALQQVVPRSTGRPWATPGCMPSRSTSAGAAGRR